MLSFYSFVTALRRQLRHAVVTLSIICSAVQLAASGTNGFAVKFTSADGKSTDQLVLPNLWLFVGAANPPAPFVPPGSFTAEFAGFIHADLRSTYLFKAERLSGSVVMQINGTNVFSASGTGGSSVVSAGVQLNKGANPVKVTFKSGAGDSFMRIGWTERGTNVNPIPDAWISHPESADLATFALLHLGRELFLEYRCARCHSAPAGNASPEVSMDAPNLDGIGARQQPGWIAAWALDPKQMRRSARMPQLLTGASAAQDARAVAAFLATLREPKTVTEARRLTAGNPPAEAEIEKRSGPAAKPTLAGDGSEPSEHSGEQKPLFHRLHCTACHNAPDSKEANPEKISLTHLGMKFQAGQLAAFLKRPDQHYAWTRMPDFRLADAEVRELSEFLLKHADTVKLVDVPASPDLVQRGRKLVQTSGCLNCHSAGQLQSEFTAPPLARLSASAAGCLSDKPSSAVPNFGFDAKARSALIAFLKRDRASLSRHAPLEFAARQTQALQCHGCHGHIDLVPPLEVLGGKLKPEWVAQFLAGYPNKVRADIHPKGGEWVLARMPSFHARAKWLAEGLAAQHGYGPRSPEEPPVDMAAAAIGYKLMGKDNGLSCISCHAVNDLPAMEVFESEGTNLGLSGARLMQPYFFRWMRNPLAVDPQTKMPAFFNEEGQSALTEYYEGDAEKQIHALYEYIRLGEKMQKLTVTP